MASLSIPVNVTINGLDIAKSAYSDGYAAALRDAVEAVKALLDESLEVWNCPGGTSDEDNGHYCFGADGCRHTGYRQAVAAIEALGGQS